MDSEKILRLLEYLERVQELNEKVKELEEQVETLKEKLNDKEEKANVSELASEIATQLANALGRRSEKPTQKGKYTLEEAAELAIQHYKIIPPRKGD